MLDEEEEPRSGAARALPSAVVRRMHSLMRDVDSGSRGEVVLSAAGLLMCKIVLADEAVAERSSRAGVDVTM
jgi:hypothetical protein